MIFSKLYTDLILKYAYRYKPSKYNTKYSNKYNLVGDKGFVFDIPSNVNLIAIKHKNQMVQNTIE